MKEVVGVTQENNSNKLIEKHDHRLHFHNIYIYVSKRNLNVFQNRLIFISKKLYEMYLLIIQNRYIIGLTFFCN